MRSGDKRIQFDFKFFGCVDDNAVTERVGILKVKFILVKLVYTVLWLILK